MAEPILMLALSPTMEEGTITRWHKKEGDSVANGDLLCEVETDKAVMEYESVNKGTLLAILVPDGGRAPVGAPIAVVGKPGEDVSAFRKPEARAPAPQAVAAPIGAARQGRQAAPIGAATRGGEAQAAAVEVAAPMGAARQGREAASPSGLRRIKASPLARRLARERGLDLGGLRGSGPGGRVVKRDLEGAGRMGLAAGAGAAGAAAAFPAAGLGKPAPAGGAGGQRLPISGKRKVIAQRVWESKQNAPHYYLKIDLIADRLLEARQRLNARLAAQGAEGKVSLNSFLIKLSAETLKRHPVVNSSWQGDHILAYDRADIGLAVAQEDGLITPVVRDCGAKGILAIERELADLIARARTNRLRPEEYTGATFTITNLGSYGILEFSAIINPPGSAILAVGRVHRQPVVEEGDQLRVRSQLILTLSCDHRVVDGAVGAAFLSDLKAMIEDPIEALL
jgi:pyruvate dehydrogenase E2 component (dihydrolipoamide acetyltransferase)